MVKGAPGRLEIPGFSQISMNLEGDWGIVKYTKHYTEPQTYYYVYHTPCMELVRRYQHKPNTPICGECKMLPPEDIMGYRKLCEWSDPDNVPLNMP